MHGFVQLRESINLPVSVELFDHEHSSPPALLSCRETRGHCGGRAQHAIWNSAAGRKRTNRQTRRSSWHEIIQSKTVLAPSGWRRVVRVGQTVHTTMFPSYYDGFADDFLFSDSNFTMQR